MKNSFSSLQSLVEIRDQVKVDKKPQKKTFNKRPQVKMFNRGHELKYVAIGDKNVPVIQNKNCFVMYPTPAEQIRLPEGCVGASYKLKEDGTGTKVEFYGRNNEVIMTKKNSYHDPLPIPEYFSEIESVEEILDLDLETGQVTCEVRFDILDEQTHWTLRMIEYAKVMEAKGMKQDVINRRLETQSKALKEQRGVNVNDPNFRIPQNVKNAIDYIERRKFFTNTSRK